MLLRINRHDVRRRADLFRLLRRDLIGADVAVEVWRAGRSRVVACKPAKLEG